MTDQAMSPLRRRMIEDMTIRKLAPKTQQGYIRTIKDFAAVAGNVSKVPNPDLCAAANCQTTQSARRQARAARRK